MIGKLLTGTSAQIASSTDNIALHLAPTNIGSLTLGLAQIEPGSSMVAASTSNTYSGGTIIDGGALYAANGATYATSGTLNSATGTGLVTVDSVASPHGTLGGSSAGGAVGMPGTGPVTVNSGGTLVPAGSNWTTAAAPAFNVLGDLTLNAGSTVNYAFDSSHQDNIAVGGSLTLPTSGQVTINVERPGRPHERRRRSSRSAASRTPSVPRRLSLAPTLPVVGLLPHRLPGLLMALPATATRLTCWRRGRGATKRGSALAAAAFGT